jgi:methyl-accepting chemotaxis protein
VKFATDVTERVRAISEIGAGLGRLAECNIRVTIDDAFVSEFEPLRRDFNNSIAAFQETLSLVLDQTYVQNRSGQDMRKAAEELSERTRKQAVALEETAAALTQATIAVRSSTERTRETRKLVQDARVSASSSAQVVNDTVSAMQRIEAASSEIGQIIGVIDEIAFQTNLLALNAGVEAARAGDAGRGFAVVAQEVRELAQRSAKAAREIKTLITNSGAEVQDGVRLVGETGRALQEIGSFVQKINENVDAIATSAAEQASGLEEISAAVSDVDRITQENAAMVEHTTATSQTLAEGAVKLSDLVNRFQLNRRARRRDGGDIWTPEERAARLGTMRKAS